MDELKNLIKTTVQKFDVVAINESRIKSNVAIITNIILPNIEYMLKKNQPGETLLYISSKTAYKPRKDQEIRRSYVLESTFIWKNKPKKSNIILSVGYRHPIIDCE